MKKLGGASKVNGHNQVILPKIVKDFLGVKTGDVVGFIMDERTRKVCLFTSDTKK